MESYKRLLATKTTPHEIKPYPYPRAAEGDRQEPNSESGPPLRWKWSLSTSLAVASNMGTLVECGTPVVPPPSL